MTNRLHLPWLQRLLLTACLFPWTSSLIAQCECGAPTNNGVAQVCAGDVFTLTYTGPDTIYVGASCTGVLSTGSSSSISFMPTPASTIQSISGGYSNGDDVPAGTIVTYQYIVSDNVTIDTLCFHIEFVDTIPPTLNTVIPNDTVNCEVANFTKWWEAQVDSLSLYAADNCNSIGIFHTLPDTLVDNCGIFTDTFIVVDIFGNITLEIASYTIQDTEAPFFTSFPPDLDLQCGMPIPPPATVTADDNCAVSVTPIFLGADTIPIGAGACAAHKFEIHRTWRVTDGCGNITDSTQIISVDDTTLPTFTAPADITISCGMPTDVSATGNITNVSDNCTANPISSVSQTQVGGTCPQEFVITRTWQVTDACGNSLSKSQKITVEDNTAPTAVFPADITVACFDDTDDSLTGVPTMQADNCHPNPTTSRVDVITAGPCDHTFTVERTWRVQDACGNATTDVQIITVKDTIAPTVTVVAVNQTVTCDVDIAAAFNNWISLHGAAKATDNCVVPGDSLEWNAFVAGTSTLATLPPPDCANPIPGIFTRVSIDFVVSDKCGNTDTTTAIFTVADNDPPVIVNCPNDVTLDTDPGQCTREMTLLLPVVMENCGNATLPVNLSISQTPTIPNGADPVETPINDLLYQFNVNGPPYSAQGNATLTIMVEKLDAEAPTEYLSVFGENGALLGTVANTAGQCGDTMSSFTIAASLMDVWAFDGVLNITVKPNIPTSLPGRFSVNPICPNSLVTAILSYETNFPAGLRFEYAVNNGPRSEVAPLAPFDAMFGQGVNRVDYYFTDCAGNEANCHFNITVRDREVPAVVCPPDQTITLDADLCEKEVEVPLFSSVTDNCAVTTPSTETLPADSLASLISFSFNPNLGDFVADDKTFVFSGLQGNATPGGVKLIIELQADVDSIGEYFRIFANGLDLGTTAPGQAHVIPGDCSSPSLATFTVPAGLFNDWAAQGDITVEAVSFMSFPIPPAGPTWGINPCDTSQVQANGDTDGSYMKATFSYESVSPVFSATGATTLLPRVLTPPLEADTFLLNQGITTFTYSVTDLAGNEGQCSFDINLLDTQAPTALCGPAFVDINPSGFDVDTVFASEIDLGSTDNCSITSMVVAPAVFDCSDQGTNFITLTVTDPSGNVSVCSTFVNVTTQQPAPTAISQCGSKDMQLFANPPASSAGNNSIYNYRWFNPSGVLFSFLQNPVIQDADLSDIGFYIVEITGVTGCVATGSVQVTCPMLPLETPLLQTPSNTICASENIVLNTPAVCGANVIYKWYTGQIPGVLMATTAEPTYSMAPPTSGNFLFYVVVERNGCSSPFSNLISVQVNAAPVATAGQTNVSICAGEQILLSSINVPQGATCQWTGPCGFSSSSCNPAPINNSSPCNNGIYELVVTRNGCPSVPDTVLVNVTVLPQTPSISSNTSALTPACNGSTVVLTATQVNGAVSYQWTSPIGTTMTTTGNTLTIPNADINKDAGLWRVKIFGNPCESLLSAPTTVHIAPLPETVTAAATPGSVCEGQQVQLTASSASQNVTYLWTYPNGQTNASPNPVISNITAQNGGTYQLVVTSQFGCSVTRSVPLTVLSRVAITGISSNEPDCVSGPVNVQLVSTLFPIDNGTYQYLWTGPNGFVSTNPSAIILGGTSTDDNGPYTLVVTNASGCSSLPATVNVEIPAVLPTPNIPTLAIANPHCVGGIVSLQAQPYTASNASYLWTTPAGQITTTTPTLVLDDLSLTDEGNYSVRYVVSGCQSAISGLQFLDVNPIPVIQPTSNSPVCAGDGIQLAVGCSAGAAYEWFGPSFGSAACNPLIPNADPALHTGTYSVRKREGGCWSEIETINVVVKPKPTMPNAFNAGPYCASTEDVMLSVANSSATAGATYQWFSSATGLPVGNPSPALNFAVPNANLLGNGNNFQFFVVANLDGCPSTASLPTTVSINTIPANAAEAGPHIDACQGDNIVLAGTPPSIGTGVWTSSAANPPGVVIFNPDQAGTGIDGLTTGETYTFIWTLSNGACEDYSSDETTVFVNKLEIADAGDPITLCHATIATLTANTPTSNVGQWSQPLSQQMLGINIITPGNPTTIISGLVPGNDYIFTWTIDGGCGSSTDAIIVTVTNEDAFAGADFEICGNGSTEINAVPALSGIGSWSSPDQGIVFVTPTSPSTTAMNLQPGENILVWTINNGSCGQFSTDSVFVEYEFAPVGVNDTNNVVAFAGALTINVTNNDFIPAGFDLAIVKDPAHGKAELAPNGRLTYQAETNFIGTDSLVYEICSEGCTCARATVYFSVGRNAGCTAPSIITPNDDGMNDAFVVPCLADVDENDGRLGYPDNKVSIFNQWGDEVFQAKPYRNNWKGTFDGEDLPAGTYFFIIDLGNGDAPTSGYLILQR